jgi:hypothetical protein
MADGSGLLIYGQIELACRIRSLPSQITFQVANIADDAILGMNFFIQNQCSLILDQGVLSINGKLLPCVDKTGYQTCQLKILKMSECFSKHE